VPLIKLMPGVRECLTARHFALALLMSRFSLAETANFTASALIKRGIRGVFPSRRECTAIPVRKGSPTVQARLCQTPARRTCRAVTPVGQVSVGLASGLIK
jgi:hypothetical protein